MGAWQHRLPCVLSQVLHSSIGLVHKFSQLYARAFAAPPGHRSDVSIYLRHITAVVNVVPISQAFPLPTAYACVLVTLTASLHNSSGLAGKRAVRWRELRGRILDRHNKRMLHFARSQGPQPRDQFYSWHRRGPNCRQSSPSYIH